MLAGAATSIRTLFFGHLPHLPTDRTHGHTVTSNRIEQMKEEMYLGVIHLLTNLKFCYVSGAHDLSSAMRLRHRLSHGSSCFIY